MFIAIMITLGALISAFLVTVVLRFANEAFSLGMDPEDSYILGFGALFGAAGLAVMLHLWLGVPAALLFLATPIVVVALLMVGTAAVWLFTKGFSKLDDFVVAQGRQMRDRLNENHEDRNA